MRGCVIALLLLACANPGTEGDVCYGNGTCNDGLTCLSDRCVTLPDGGMPPIDAGIPDAGRDAATALDAGRDAGSDAGPDAGPLYPPGPYGMAIGDVIADLTFTGFVDTAVDADSDPTNEPSRSFSLHELFAGNDPDARVIQIDIHAGWCGTCMTPASELSALAGDYIPRGARFVEVLIEGASGSPIDLAYVDGWVDRFAIIVPSMADPANQLGGYFDIVAFPQTLYVDATDMTILNAAVGITPDADRRALLDYYTTP